MQATPHAFIRPPIVTVMGHIDHGKSTLLDCIRSANVAATEVAGITQHVGAYEVVKFDSDGNERRMTFLDTPGHEAFKAIRSRGAAAADLAILVVAADDGVKAQTIEAISLLKSENIPYVVAVTKIDKPGANADRALASLAEQGVFVEGRGGDVPHVSVSGKTEAGVPELLDVLILLADLKALTGDPALPGKGYVLEASIDPKRGIAGTLIIQNGTLRSGTFVVAGSSTAPVRIMEDFAGRRITEASMCAPVKIVGFSELPPIGSPFTSHATRRDAELHASRSTVDIPDRARADDADTRVMIPIVVKADVAGSVDAILHELGKRSSDRVHMKVIRAGVGTITEDDAQALGSDRGVIVGFNVKVDPRVGPVAERRMIEVAVFDTIYKLAEWADAYMVRATPKITVEEEHGSCTILKTFGRTKERQVVGGRITSGALSVGDRVRIVRRGVPIGSGSIVELQSQKVSTKRVDEGNECGAKIESRIEIAPRDVLSAFSLVER